MPKIFPYCGKFPIASKIITSTSVFIALLMTVNTTVLAEPTPAPIPNPSPPAQTQKPIAEQLLGEWQTTNPSSQDTLTFIFAPEGKLFILSPPSESEKRLAVELNYSIDATQQPMQIDITLPNVKEKVLTIFEITPDGKLRLQIENTDPGKSRPKTFSAAATLFKRNSDSRKLPENVKLVDPNSKP
ncbi:MAG: hypothetical protein KA716_08875 [Gloeotrichia echinulata DEX184]|jgi:hypothetical protein|nr:hypothetical protein [Gloeotrichia echinulata DEX184]